MGEGFERAKFVENLPSTLIEGVTARLREDDTYERGGQQRQGFQRQNGGQFGHRAAECPAKEGW